MASTDDATPRRTLVLLFGGRSAEHDVSCVSARHVLAAVDTAHLDIVPVGIDREGSWSLAEAAADAHAAGDLPDALDPSGPAWDPLPRLAELAAAGPVVVFPLLHGPLGEDGTVQGLLEVADVPYVGAGVLGSALAMDKLAAKEVLAHHGIPQARYRGLHADRLADPGSDGHRALLDELLADLGPSVFVKPANLGSSVGVSRATDTASLDEVLEPTFYTHAPPTQERMQRLIEERGGDGIVVSLQECLETYDVVRGLLRDLVPLPADPRDLREWSLSMAMTGSLLAARRGLLDDVESLVVHASGSYAVGDYVPVPAHVTATVGSAQELADVVRTTQARTSTSTSARPTSRRRSTMTHCPISILSAVDFNDEVIPRDDLVRTARDMLDEHGYVQLVNVPDDFHYVDFASKFGDFVPNYGGPVVGDVRPEPGMEDVYHAGNTRPLTPHTEGYDFTTPPPRYLMLWCVTPASGEGGETTIGDTKPWIEALDDSDREHLYSTVFHWKTTDGIARKGLDLHTEHPVLEDMGAPTPTVRFSCNNLLHEDDDVAVPVEGLHRGLLVVEAGHHQIAVVRRVLDPGHHAVAVEDAGVDHRVAADPQHEQVALAGELGREGERLLDVLVGQHAGARCHVADQRHVADRPPFDGGAGRRVEADLHGPRLAGVAADEAPVLEGGQVGVDGRRGGEADRRADLADRRWIAALSGLGVDELKDLLLSLAEPCLGHGAFFPLIDRRVPVDLTTNICSIH